MLINRRTIEIQWGDCDPAGIVYFPRFFEYFDACTNALFESAGLPKPDMLRKYQLVGIPLVDARARFIIPSSFGDIVAVDSCVTEWGRSSFSVSHKLFRGDTLAVEGFEKRVWTIRDPHDPSRLRGEPVPRDVMARFD